MTKQDVLILSPFAFEPADAGHRRRVAQSLNFFSDARITFLLYAFEGAWQHVYQYDLVKSMTDTVQQLLVFKARPDIGASPVNALNHQLDEWYDRDFELYLKNILKFRTFDVVVVHNVWMSKYLDLFRFRTVKIIEAHDIFSERAKEFIACGAEPEFFYTSTKDEIFGYNRSDIVISIQEQDEKWIVDRCSAQAVTVSYVPSKRPSVPLTANRKYMNAEKVTFGFIGLSHVFNIAGMRKLLEVLQEEIGTTLAPIELLIAGSVCNQLQDMRAGFWKALGWVPDEDAFVGQCDIMVVPIDNGTGFKVKVADSLCLGKPLIATEHAVIGVPKTNKSWVMANAEQVAKAMVQLAYNRPSLDDLVKNAYASAVNLEHDFEFGKARLERAIRARQLTFALDLETTPDVLSLILLAAYSGAMRIFSDYAKVVVATTSEKVASLIRHHLPGASIISEISSILLMDRLSVIVLTGAHIHGQIRKCIILDSQLEQELVKESEWLPAVPFGTNVKWDPFFKAAFAKASNLAENTNCRDTAIFGSQDNFRQLFSASILDRMDFYNIDSMKAIDCFTQCILSKRISKVIMIDTKHKSASKFLHRLLDHIGINVVIFDNDGSNRSDPSTESHDAFWHEIVQRAVDRLKADNQNSSYKFHGKGSLDIRDLSQKSPGLYQPEFDLDNRVMVWASGNHPVSITIPAEFREFKLIIRGLSYLKVNSIVVTINHNRQVSECNQGIVGDHEFTFCSAEGVNQEVLIEIEFRIGESPKDRTKINTDPRRLSFLIYNIEIVEVFIPLSGGSDAINQTSDL